MNLSNVQLPEAMRPYAASLLDARLPLIRIKPGKRTSTGPLQSKVGGMPYLPDAAEWPRSAEHGEPLFFLAQLNFAEMPPLPPFPTQGILQFFIADDDLYGMDLDQGESQRNFCVRYHPDPDPKAAVDLPDMAYRPHDLLPHHPDESYPLTFEAVEELPSVSDYRFNALMGADFFTRFGEAEWDVIDAYAKVVHAQGHKIGGYAYFTQDDPRTPADPMLLLFQLDSDESMDLMWGDMGIGHFFIRESDLKALRFDRVLYDWDGL